MKTFNAICKLRFFVDIEVIDGMGSVSSGVMAVESCCESFHILHLGCH